MSGRSEWALDSDQKIFDGKTEAQFYAQSIADVSRHYGGDLLDQKTVDWLNLIQCLALIYGGRIMTIRMTPRVRPTRQPTAQETARTFSPQGSSVTDIPNPFEKPPPVPEGIGTGEIAGIGNIEFPEGHPLNPRRH